MATVQGDPDVELVEDRLLLGQTGGEDERTQAQVFQVAGRIIPAQVHGLWQEAGPVHLLTARQVVARSVTARGGDRPDRGSVATPSAGSAGTGGLRPWRCG